MKQSRSILSMVFTFLVLFSSSSFMVGIHLCSGSIQNIALFSKAESCAMEKMMPPCHRQESKPCCEDELIVHQGEDFKTSPVDINIAPAPTPDTVLPFVFISEVIPSSSFPGTQFFNYDPPLRAGDLTVSLHSFLIWFLRLFEGLPALPVIALS